ncbi:MAG: choice-of-anchor tandem repeat GloVer-containing protein, partial [Candidatus Sulfotelmatobacter sp.]
MNRGWKTACFVTLWAAAAISSSAQNFTTLHTFDITDGAFPSAALVQGLDGNFYGTTANGGRELCNVGCGTVFKITPDGTLTTLHEFVRTDGQ